MNRVEDARISLLPFQVMQAAPKETVGSVSTRNKVR